MPPTTYYNISCNSLKAVSLFAKKNRRDADATEKLISSFCFLAWNEILTKANEGREDGLHIRLRVCYLLQ